MSFVYAHPLFDLNLTERIDANGPAIARVVRHTGYSLAGLRIGPDPTDETDARLSVVSGRELTFAGGLVDVDLTALPTANGVVVDGTGLKVRLMQVENPRGNGTVVIAPGPTNGYPLFGASGQLALGGQSSHALFDADGLAVVSATEKVVRLSGTDGETVRFLLALG